ncbi:MAG: response regulator transcription factor [Hyphomonadaceae bacterium]|nr:MAG: LuxR family transcriptional regulator [Caulobacteraceae bacterium]MBT9447436.1 response regulator transcription factor [Hyphomonadaceae bacterium]TPW08781.1 MAG: LuxR family transcriptional regulator [Alphaproteobacteria bacterium]
MGIATALIVDDHELFRGGLKLLLNEMVGFEHIVEVGNFEQAQDVIVAGLSPDLVTFDLSMPGLSGEEGLAALADALPNARLVVIAGSERREDILGALGAGAHGYIPKSLGAAETAAALRDVLAGRIFVPKVLNRGDQALPQPHVAGTGLLKGYSFTARQRSVVDCLLTGASTRKIAADLGLAEGTVKIHLAAIFRIVGVHSRAEVIAKLK